MIYSVIPRELEGELFEKLSAYYADEDGVTVIVDRRHFDRRARDRRSSAAHAVSGEAQRRVIRDRRRARVVGDTLPLALGT
ncbi:MAG TPA: hypothetical protein VH115_08285 [Solirubrobacteraceae bacterium]|nr:hypothetical protein [Solirubrobacteraceae bacterium]